ncbi:MAG: zf-TFIIB domain-containing protein [Bacteroidales bacterium]|nr:zf-TFIIB domain-containing protein [Bacteroidales bacterium]
MICPRCNNNLMLSNTQGVEIDHCPNCRGVWLDRGELEKIIERSNGYNHSNIFENRHQNHDQDHYDKHQRQHHDEHGHGNYPPKHKRGFLSDLFDF